MTEYSDFIDRALRPNVTESETVIDLFAGCGGLSLGFEAAGYKTIGFEMQTWAAETYSVNMGGLCFNEKLRVGKKLPQADIVIGGPPCQPFSVRGKQGGKEDDRDGFPMFIDTISRLAPRLFLFENVRNLMFSHKWYLNQILAELRDLGNIVDIKCVNAVKHRVPQNRERIVVVGHKSSFSYPTESSTRVSVSEAIGDTMHTFGDDSKFLNAAQDEYIAKYEKASHCVNPRDLHPDKPARTLTCRNLAGATSDMQRVRLPDGRRRRISVNEAARLQSFPDWFKFMGNEQQQFTQIGNAVPPLLAMQLANSVKATLRNKDLRPEEIRRINATYKPL